ncbi:MAG: recombinase RecT [Dehalococcoidia bacterium]|nr:recombinase RecT [Dehalococcoidia bacterium]
MQEQLFQLLPRNIDRAKYIRLALGCLREVPALNQCTPASFLSALFECAGLGLEPNTALGEAYILPYKDRAQLIIGYKGFKELMYRSGLVSKIDAHAVYQGDDFEYEFGLNEKLRHVQTGAPVRPETNGQTGGNVTHAWVKITMKDGEVAWDAMNRAQIEDIRRRSPAAWNGPWVTDYEPMSWKTVLRRKAKLMPLSPQIRRAITLDEEGEAALPQTYTTTFKVMDDKIEADNLPEESEPEQGAECFLHPGEFWTAQTFGKDVAWRHALPDKKWCNPGAALRQLAESQGMDATDLNNELKRKWSVTSSGLTPEQAVEYAAYLTQPPEGGPATEAPVVQDSVQPAQATAPVTGITSAQTVQDSAQPEPAQPAPKASLF